MKFLIIILSILTFFSCTQKLILEIDKVEENYTDGNFSKIAIVGTGSDLEARNEFEQRTTKLYKKKGVNAIPGITIFPANMTKEEQKTSNIIQIIKKNKVDAVLTMSLIDIKDLEDGKNDVQQDEEFFDYLIYAFGGDASIGKSNGQEKSKSYVIEAVLYDLRGELKEENKTMVWRGHTSIDKPYSIADIATTFSKTLVSHTINEKIIVNK